MKLTFFVTPEGKLPEGIKFTLSRVIPEMAGKKVLLSLAEAKDKRSLDQNALYWSAIVPHVRNFRLEMGDPVSIDQTHEDLLAQFAPVVESKRMDGTSYIRPMRSKEMNVEQFSAYVTAIIAAMAQFDNPVKELI